MNKQYSEEFDAMYDADENVWLEPSCQDPACDFCANRPDKPLPIISVGSLIDSMEGE